MRKLSALLSFFLICLVEFSIGQVQSPQPYSYNFGTALPSPAFCENNCTTANFFAGVLSDAGVIKADSESGAVSSTQIGKLFTYVTDNNIVNNNAQNVFMFRAAESLTKGSRFAIDEFGRYGTADNQTHANKNGMIAFKFKLGNDNPTVADQDGEIVLALGKSTPSFSTANIPAIDNLSNNNTFLAIRFTLTNNILTTRLFSNGTWVTPSQPLNVPMNQTNTIEIYANNEAAPLTRDAGGYGPMPPSTWYLRINGVGMAMTTIGGLNPNQEINSFMIIGAGSPRNSFYMYMDDLRYSTQSSTAAALPVSLKSFKANALPNANQLSWTTSSETNNKGFEIQRSMGNTNDFKTIGFVGTKAKQGNSEAEISYSFEDANVKAGQTHYYRLNQVDFDGKSVLSSVKSIKPGSIESNLNVYPNPSQGSFTVNTGSNSGKLNIFVMDNTGRIVNQFMNVSTSNTRINNLKKGFYTLKIVNTESGQQSAQKIVVQ
jgi:hypothetical protein